MRRTDEQIAAFSTWAHGTLARVRHEPSAEIADAVGEQLLRIECQLGVEVGDDLPGDREMILTSFSDPRLFTLVHRIAASVSDIPGWRVRALKPARGFAFRLSVGRSGIDAKALRFAPLADVGCGIRLIVPRQAHAPVPRGPEAEELAWLIVETGIGEELAGRIQHIEFDCLESAQESLPIAELEAYVRANCARD